MPETSRIFGSARELGVPAYAQDYPGSLREIPAVVRAVKAFEKLYAEHEFDLINCNGGRDHSLLAYWKLFTPSRRGVRIVRCRRAIRTVGNDPWHRWMYGKAVQANVYVSHAVYNICESHGHLATGNARVVLNGIDLERFRPPASRHDDLRRELGIPADAFVFVTAGISSYKRPDLLAKALARIASERPVRMLLLGHEPDWHRLRGKLSPKEQESLVFAGFQADPRPWFAAADAGFLLSTAVEASPFVVREMMACGLPVLGANFSGIIELITDASDGFLVQTGDLEDTIRGAQAFLTLSPEALAVMARMARTKAEAAFGIDRHLDGMDRVFSDVLARQVVPA